MKRDKEYLKLLQHQFNRRQLLKAVAAGAGLSAVGPLLAACGGLRPGAEGGVAAPAADEEVIVAFAHVGPVSDEGWTWSHDQGRQAVVNAFPNVETPFVENMPYSEEATRTLEQFVSDGAKMIFITSTYDDYVKKVAERHPNVAFLECDGHNLAENHMWYYIAHWDPSYLIGMAAGMLTESNKLGYVGSFPVQSVYCSVNSFHLGARAVNPNVQTQAVLINSWFDPAAATQSAQALIDDGVDFLFGIMDEAGYLQVAEERGIRAAMWNTDMRRFGPNAYVSSVELFWNDFYVNEVEAFLEGTWQGNRGVILPIGDGVDRDDWGETVPEEVRQEVDAVRAQMIDDNLNVFVGPISDTTGEVRVAEGEVMSEMDLYTWDWAVEGVSGMPVSS